MVASLLYVNNSFKSYTILSLPASIEHCRLVGRAQFALPNLPFLLINSI